MSMKETAEDYAKSDDALKADKEFLAQLAKFNPPAPADVLAKTVKALTDKKYIVKVVKTEAEAVEYLNSLIPDGSSLSTGSSTTLAQIGFIDALKERDSKITNYKSQAVAAQAKGDSAAYGQLITKGYTADAFLSSCSAISADGDLFVVDLTGSRLGGWTTAGKLVVVAGTNKVVVSEAEAEARIQYQLKLESARVRVAYKIPGSMISNKVVIKAGNPMGAPRIHVVLIEKTLGF